MWKFIEVVKIGEVVVIVLVGNIGVFMVMFKFCLCMMVNIECLVIVVIWLMLCGEFVVFDVGVIIGVDV